MVLLNGLFRSKFFKILFLIVILVSLFKFYTNYRQIQELDYRIVALEDNITLAKEEREILEKELKNISDPKFIERVARQELGLVKPGELLIIPIEEEK